FVQVATGESFPHDGQPSKNSYYRGFLVKDNGRRFIVFTASLTTRTHAKTGPDKPEHEKVAYEACDLEAEMTKLLKQAQQPSEEHGWPRRFGERLSEPAELFVWARACAAQGKPKLAGALLEQARRAAGPRGTSPAFLDAVADDIAHAKI